MFHLDNFAQFKKVPLKAERLAINRQPHGHLLPVPNTFLVLRISAQRYVYGQRIFSIEQHKHDPDGTAN